MSRTKEIQKAVERYRKKMAPGLDKDLVEKIIEIQATMAEDPTACQRRIDRLLDQHLEAK